MSIEEMARIALRYDTTMSRAMLRACGVPVPEPRPRAGAVVRCDRYDGLAWCMGNPTSPMDWPTW